MVEIESKNLLPFEQRDPDCAKGFKKRIKERTNRELDFADYLEKLKAVGINTDAMLDEIRQRLNLENCPPLPQSSLSLGPNSK